MRSLIAACVEGVNVSVLAVGSATSQTSRVLFSPMLDQSLAVAIFQSLFDALQNKIAALNNNSSSASEATANGGTTSARKNQVVSSATFSLRLSFAELFEESITDLLAPRDSSRQDLYIEDDAALGKIIKNLTQSAPLTSAGSFRQVLDAGLGVRRSTNGLYGNSSEFSSAVLRISVKQTFSFCEAPAQELHSFFDIVDVPATDRLTRLGKLLSRVCTFPVVNNDMLRGLRRRRFLVQKQLVSVATADGKQDLADYERRLHDLEGKLAQSGLERRMLREDKDALTAQVGELRLKYRELFDNELSLRTELLSCEQEKLALSKAFVAFQLERDTHVQQLDSDKFEAETRLLKAEQLVVEIQQDDATKAGQIQDLCVKMNELVADKTRLGGELSMLQKAVKAAECARDAEAKKNQQLSLELIVAVNQKQKFQGEMETLATQLRARQSQVDDQQAECAKLRSDNEALRLEATEFEAKLEAMRKDLVRRELELERADLAVKKEQLETQQAGRDADCKRECSVKQLSEELETQRSAFAADKRSLELQLERVQGDLKREIREKHLVNTALKSKNEENEDLQLAVERARHDLQAQLKTFRLKLALLHQSRDDAEAGTGIRALRELLASYQVREGELRDELDSARNACFRLTRRLRESASASQQNGEEPHAVDEMEHLRERLDAAEQQLAVEMQQRSEQALILAELEAQNSNLLREQKERQQHEQTAPAKDNDTGVREMHAALTHQLEEVRRLTLQQQTTQSTHPTQQISSNNPADPSELETLRAAKTQLESRLSSTKAYWMKLQEQVERRCAELLTKNVMLTEDNENLRNHLIKAMKRT
ncbi:hypothetical protein JG688_00007392 [Phytophthora aleatoria]|uniref:DUF4472 domain-containing protein n=1 Tax=Phytophthora aleatoria TaxID=2496075 RepID=A0A8J5J9R0_9STRA|nr:hypothetical protein JG688_00007392 [Phytophthora aleatoria]